jgi:hypothetical protein
MQSKNAPLPLFPRHLSTWWRYRDSDRWYEQVHLNTGEEYLGRVPAQNVACSYDYRLYFG